MRIRIASLENAKRRTNNVALATFLNNELIWYKWEYHEKAHTIDSEQDIGEYYINTMLFATYGTEDLSCQTVSAGIGHEQR